MIARARPLYFVGDSNTIAFRYISTRAPDEGDRIVTVAGRLLMQTCSSLLSGEKLVEPFDSFLRARLHGSERPMPVVVLMVGTMDLATLLRTFGTRTDVRLPGGDVPAGFPGPAFPTLPPGLLASALERQFEPLRRAITLVTSMGICRLVLHSLHPPTVDDVRYFSIRRVTCTARARYGMVRAINVYLERLATEAGIAFLNMWDATTVDGVLDERLSFEGDHLNYEGALLTIDALLRAGFY